MRTKIIATLGPATADRDRMGALFDAGLDVCRLNLSHGDLSEHEQRLRTARTVAAERGIPLCVIADLGGPKVRVGVCEKPFNIATGQTIAVVRGQGPCTPARLTVSYESFVDEVAVGQRVLIDDGLVRLVVAEKRADELVLNCTAGGQVSSRKGVNLPDTTLSTPALTAKDRVDAEWAMAQGVEYVALSFVRQPEDLYELKRLVKQRNSDVQVIAKIEKAEALWHIDELLAHADAILVARGDLGIETDLWRVPLIQKDLVASCHQAGVPVIVATQMLQSMIDYPLPTRAEVSDVASAILDRVDAVMLSGETAVGKYPVETVDMMNRIAVATEDYLEKHPPPELPCLAGRYRPSAAVAHAAVAAARDLNARLVAVWSATGATVRMVAKHRLGVPVVGLSYSERVCQQMNLLFGVVPIRVEPLDHPAKMAAALDECLLRRNLVVHGDVIVVVTSTRPTTPGATDTALVRRVGDSA